MISSSTCAARGSCDCPSQKIAFLRSSRSCSVLAILISASSAADSWRCEYTKISCSFISRFCIRSYSPANSPRSAPLWPAQNSAFLRCSTGSRSFTATSIIQRMFSVPPICESEKRSEEHTSELQSRPHLVCRLLLEKKKNKKHHGSPAV